MTGMHAARLFTAHEPSQDVFARVGAFLAEHRLSADPANYEFAYAVVSDPDGTLAARVARVAEGGVRLSGEDIERFGGTAAPGVPVALPIQAHADEAVDGLIARTQVQVESFAHTMRAMHAETRGFGEDLAAAIDTRGALPAIDEVARLTSTMIERVREAEIRLDAATREADDLRTALAEARGSARRDPLTDLPNRRAFDEAFAALAPGEPVAIAICDIDHFKAINDTFGHAIGDRVLKAIGQALVEDCADCLVARYGGEEFVVLISGAANDAFAMLDRARARIAGKRFRSRDTNDLLGSVTLSAGVAAVRGSDTLEDVLTRADVALYSAKSAGRNCIQVAE